MSSPESVGTLEVGAILTGLGGGLALFLYGMRKMTESLKVAAGGGMKALLGKLTANRFTGALAGIIITAVIQSSSVTTVLVVGFISAGLMTLSQSVGVILGAAVGTTVTAQIIAFKVTKYALVLIALGFLTELLAKKERLKHIGIMVMGLGLIFFGMELMSQATYPLRTYQPFINLMQTMRNPFLGILVGTVFTAIVQSSSATTGVVIVLAGQGFISLNAGIALVFGANVGTCVTALLATIGKPREAARAAAVHILYKVLGVLIWLAFIPQLADVVRSLSPASPELEGVARLAAESPRQIANAHTLFNVANMLIFIWFTGPLARLATRLVPDRKETDTGRIKPKFLDDYYLSTPPMALDKVREELGHLGERAMLMARRSFSAVLEGEQDDLNEIARVDDEVDDLHADIISYLGRLSLKDLVEPQPKRIYEYIAAANYIENVGDVVETNLVEEGKERLRLDLEVSDSTRDALAALHAKACWALENALQSLVEPSLEKARAVAGSKGDFNRLAEEARTHLAKRLVADEPHRLATFRVETDILENFKRLHTLARRIAGVVEEVEGPRKGKDGSKEEADKQEPEPEKLDGSD